MGRNGSLKACVVDVLGRLEVRAQDIGEPVSTLIDGDYSQDDCCNTAYAAGYLMGVADAANLTIRETLEAMDLTISEEGDALTGDVRHLPTVVR